MSTSNAARRLLSVGATICLILGAVIGVAAAASANDRPVARATATVAANTAQVHVSANRGTNQIRTATCALDGVKVSCGPAAANGKKAATYAPTFTGLSSGRHHFTITIVLTDGGRFSACTSFKVSASQPLVLAAGPSTNEVLVTVTVPHPLGNLTSSSCTLDGAAVPCHPTLLSGQDPATSSYRVRVAGLSTGQHTFGISVGIAGQSAMQGTVDFPTAYADPQATCEAAGGSYSTPTVFKWQCDKTFASPDDEAAGEADYLASLAPACDQQLDGGPSLFGPQPNLENVVDATASASCGFPNAWELAYSCGGVASGVDLGHSDLHANCVLHDENGIPLPANPLLDSIWSQACGQLGGNFSVTPFGVDDPTLLVYRCADPSFVA
jgi:hypothetical protein